MNQATEMAVLEEHAYSDLDLYDEDEISPGDEFMNQIESVLETAIEKERAKGLKALQTVVNNGLIELGEYPSITEEGNLWMAFDLDRNIEVLIPFDRIVEKTLDLYDAYGKKDRKEAISKIKTCLRKALNTLGKAERDAK